MSKKTLTPPQVQRSNKPKNDFSLSHQNSIALLLLAVILYWGLKNKYLNVQELRLVHNSTVPQNRGLDIYHMTMEYGPIQVGGLGAMVTQMTKAHLKRFPNDRIFIWFPWTLGAQIAFKGECHLQRDAMVFPILEHVNNQVTQAHIHSCPMLHYNVTVLFADLPQHIRFRKLTDSVDTRIELVYHKAFDIIFYLSQIVAKAMEMRILDNSKQPIVRKSILQLHSGRFGLIASQLRHPNKNPEVAEILKRNLKIVAIWHDYYYEHFTHEENIYSLKAMKQLVHEPKLYFNQESKLINALITAAHSDATICVSTKMRDRLANGKTKVVKIHNRWWSLVKKRPFLAVSNNLALNEMRHNPWKSLIEILPNGRLLYQGQKYNSFVEVKQAAKKQIIEIFNHKLAKDDLASKTWIIYTGRMDEMKGSSLLGAASNAIKALTNASLIVVANMPLPEPLRSKLSSNRVILMDSEHLESLYGILFRLAADIAFIPSRQEAFGLVGVESFLYGQMLVNSRAVGLLEYSKDYKQKLNETTKEVQSNWLKSVRNCIPLWMNENTPSYCYNLTRQSPFSFNSVQFNVHISETTNLQQDEIQVTNALNKAVRLYQSMNAIQREQFLWHQVSNAGPFVMERPGGMVDQYRDIYLQLT